MEKVYGIREGQGQWLGSKGKFTDKNSLERVIRRRDDVDLNDKLLLSPDPNDALPMQWDQADFPSGTPYITVTKQSSLHDTKAGKQSWHNLLLPSGLLDSKITDENI